MERSISADIYNTLKSKLVLLSGPRQAGKTTLSRAISESFEYLNYDSIKDRKQIIDASWNRTREILILDELHKMKKWKLWLKGIYDTEKNKKIIVTGSSKLDTLKKVGDSMAGRYFHYRLMPFCLKELKANKHGNNKENLENLLSLTGFPEPFLSNSTSFYKKWRRTHLDVIIRQDIFELESVKRISDLEMLIELMTNKTGSVFSNNSLREDLLTDDKSIKRWMLALENAYVFFKITPYSKNIKNSLKKAPKYYFFDYARLNEEARLENFVALSLLKEIYFQNDVNGEDYSLHYLRDQHQKELDFLICKDKKPEIMFEVKTSDDTPSKNFSYFEKHLIKENKKIRKIQLVKNIGRNFSNKDGVLVTDLADWLAEMPLEITA